MPRKAHIDRWGIPIYQRGPGEYCRGSELLLWRGVMASWRPTNARLAPRRIC